jgi:hypothetical protein
MTSVWLGVNEMLGEWEHHLFSFLPDLSLKNDNDATVSSKNSWLDQIG